MGRCAIPVHLHTQSAPEDGQNSVFPVVDQNSARRKPRQLSCDQKDFHVTVENAVRQAIGLNTVNNDHDLLLLCSMCVRQSDKWS